MGQRKSLEGGNGKLPYMIWQQTEQRLTAALIAVLSGKALNANLFIGQWAF